MLPHTAGHPGTQHQSLRVQRNKDARLGGPRAHKPRLGPPHITYLVLKLHNTIKLRFGVPSV